VIFVQSDHPPGVVGFIGGEIARYHSFTMCFTGLNVPAGSKLYSGIGYDSSYNRNAVIEFALKHEDVQWVQLYDDDHVFAPDTLLRLLDTGADLVVPFYVQRQPPFNPCVYREEVASGGYLIFSHVDLEGKDGLLPIVSAGAGGILIRRKVLEALKSPYFERQGLIGEDHYFFKKAREAGFQPYCALDVPLGHSTVVEVWPYRNERGEWCTKVDLKGNPPALVEYWNKKYEPVAP